ncbi:glycosyl hydrolase family 18 protein [Kribbella sp. CA-293567]|uniref:glycosyl hydrolase family 18 protein n=1 Tax=Kribbella sp. CA-293567 TaxID=3002436 RepID=UPI0022DE8FCE|nr:glycosyl hydrolase family 18 protein [Kribbella sp. CA-293567]WBQ03451.1 glycosyl hydrolase family 18 protein [Kribbella sp. CA-293567]
MKISTRWACAALALATVTTALVATVAPAPPAGAAASAVLPNGFRSVGYLTSGAGSVSSIQFGKLTHVNYAFVRPNSNGTLQAVPNSPKLSSLVSTGHNQGVKVLLAVGGWNNGDDTAFETLAANSTSRTTFVNALVGLINQYGLDGIDMDWEYPDPGASATNFTKLMQQLSGALRPKGKLLTAAVTARATTANGVQPAVFGYVDFLNIMAYDSGTPHANYQWSIDAANMWKARGLPAGKTVLGVPFYSRPSEKSYAQLIALNPAYAWEDCVSVSGTWECYNGIPTIRKKTKWAMANAGGVMYWQLAQDTTGSTSLVNAIYQVAIGQG